MKIRLAGLVVVTFAAFISSLGAQTLGTNLLINGTAEAGAATENNDVVTVPGWTVQGSATVVFYDNPDNIYGYPAQADPGPADRGQQLFTGGKFEDLSSMSQTVDVTSLASKVDVGTIHTTLSGFLGGFADQSDNVVVKAVFLNGTGTSLGEVSIGPVTPEDRGNATGLLTRSQDAAVPALTRSIVVTMTFERISGTDNDGYADNVSLVLSDTAILAASGVRIYPAYIGTPVGTTGLVHLDPAVEVTYPTVSGTNYQVERSTDLKTWANFGSQVSGTGSTVAFFDRSDLTPHQFYRIKTL